MPEFNATRQSKAIISIVLLSVCLIAPAKSSPDYIDSCQLFVDTLFTVEKPLNGQRQNQHLFIEPYDAKSCRPILRDKLHQLCTLIDDADVEAECLQAIDGWIDPYFSYPANVRKSASSIAVSLVDDGRYEQAEAILERLLKITWHESNKLQPSIVLDTYRRLAWINASMKRWDMVIHYWNFVLELEDLDGSVFSIPIHQAYLGIAEAYAEQAKISDALGTQEALIELLESSATLDYILAQSDGVAEQSLAKKYLAQQLADALERYSRTLELASRIRESQEAEQRATAIRTEIKNSFE
jgi:tetratricopeptide (TPR) repeat protein